MRRLIPVVLCSIALVAQAGGLIRLPSMQTVDLDKPGALEALQRNNPKHYEIVMKQVDEAQSVKLSDNGQRNLGFFRDGPMAEPGDVLIQPSDPARSRLTVIVDSVVYAITVRYTKDPATMVPAR